MDESQTILVADDSEDDQTLTRLALRKAGFGNPLQSVRNGEEAIAYLAGKGPYGNRAQFPLPAFILLDLKMPRKDGFEVLKWLAGQPELSQVFVIVLTASLQREDVKRAYELCAKSFLLKPTAIEDLTIMLQCLRRWLHYNHFPTAA